jgi:pimeloyl-ACP methyl ester carboxylesterase
MSDPIYASTMPILSSFPEQERCLKAASAALLGKLGPATLISHSRAGIFGWSWADARPEFIKAMVQIDPKGPLFGVIASSLSAKYSKAFTYFSSRRCGETVVNA